jgi:glycosyltransferase involved in cell wall biosynthesis
MLRVTAIIPTCDRPALLERALASIAAQELVPAETIVVDDAGGDADGRIGRIVERSRVRGARRVGNPGTKGASGARNAGAALATGELLAFLDDDDEWLPSYLAEAVAAFGARPLDVLCADLICRLDDGVDRPSKHAPERLRADLFLTRNPGLGGSNVIVRRAVYLDVGGFDESLPACNDRDFGIRLSLCAGLRYARLPRRLVRWHRHAGSRLGTPGGEAMRAGVRRFYELHSPRMTSAQREQFRENVGLFWGLDERGEIVGGPQARLLEPLLAVLKARLDDERRRSRGAAGG